jgi:hypothetical protein
VKIRKGVVVFFYERTQNNIYAFTFESQWHLTKLFFYYVTELSYLHSCYCQLPVKSEKHLYFSAIPVCVRVWNFNYREP